MMFGSFPSTMLVALRANSRLRWGAWAIAGILWLYAALVLRDQAQASAEAYLSAQKKIARVQDVLARTEWPERLEAARALRLDLEGRLWREATIGLAQASFQDWLNQTVQQAGLLKPNISVAAQETADGADSGAPALWKVSAKLGFDFSPKSFYPFLAKLATHEKRVMVESLAIRGAPVPRVELVVVALFQKPAPREGDADASRTGARPQNP